MPTALTFQPHFGKYLLLKRIAKGGMAEIFRALAFGAEGFAKLVVIKRMLPQMSGDHQFVDMFIDEAKLTAHLAHGNIAQLMDFGIVDDMLYHCMEYVQGRTLMDIFQVLARTEQPAPIRPVCKIFAEALYGLDHAHQRRDRSGRHLKIIHRDLSPTNVIVSFDGEVKIVDFGIARATHTRKKTMGGKIQGKFRYMSPEQARGDELDQRSDLFSLAVCFYELLTLCEMHEGDTDQDLISRVKAAKVEAPRRRNPEIPERLQNMLLRALSRDPQKRYPSAGEMRDELEAFLLRTGLFMTNAELARFMKQVFKGAIEAERKQIGQEVLRAEASRRNRTDSGQAAPALKTVVLKQEQLPADWELYPEGDDREDTDESEAILDRPDSKPAQQIAQDDQDSTVPRSEPEWSDATQQLDLGPEDASPNARTVINARPLGAPQQTEQGPEDTGPTQIPARRKPVPSGEKKKSPAAPETKQPSKTPKTATQRSDKMLTKPPQKRRKKR